MIAAIVLSILMSSAGTSPEAGRYFTITVVDEDSGRGVPLVELMTTGAVRYYTDSNGIVAFYEPGLMGREVFFHVKSHGYAFEADGFGYRGRKLKVVEGGSVVLKIKRLNIAERLYRVTGAGIYRDSVLVGRAAPLEQPVLDGLVVGSDSVVNAVYRGRVYWFWGDTGWPSYPLGNFNVSGATSLRPRDGGLDPDIGVNLRYFVGETGFAKPMAPVPGQGPTWIDGVVALRDESGAERLYAAYAKVHSNMVAYQRGLLEFDDGAEQFKEIVQFDLNAPFHPGGHPFTHTENGIEYVYFVKPFPLIRVRAVRSHLTDLSHYEAYTCVKQGGQSENVGLDRDAGGKLLYAWKRNAPLLSAEHRKTLVAAKKMKPEEDRFRLRDVLTGEIVDIHGGSVYWNAYRGRWVMIGLQAFGTSVLGEVWYAEADTPIGPWAYARKIVTHEAYSFYNPKQHPMFDKASGRFIFFEGTYSHTFSGNPDRTPRYDYNQIMHKLDLAGPRLVLPVAVYDRSRARRADGFARAGTDRTELGDWSVAFFALDRLREDAVPVFLDDTDPKAPRLVVGQRADNQSDRAPLFFAVPADAKDLPPSTVPLYAWTSAEAGPPLYSVGASWAPAGYRRSDSVLCRVWADPKGSLVGGPGDKVQAPKVHSR